MDFATGQAGPTASLAGRASRAPDVIASVPVCGEVEQQERSKGMPHDAHKLLSSRQAHGALEFLGPLEFHIDTDVVRQAASEQSLLDRHQLACMSQALLEALNVGVEGAL